MRTISLYLIFGLSACATSPALKPDVAIQLSITNISYDEEYGLVAANGKIKLENNSLNSICFNSDILENRFSPYTEVITKKSLSKNNSKLPNPPQTTEVSKLGPNESIQFERILGYKEGGSEQVIKLLAYYFDCKILSPIEIETQTVTLQFPDTL